MPWRCCTRSNHCRPANAAGSCPRANGGCSCCSCTNGNRFTVQSDSATPERRGRS